MGEDRSVPVNILILYGLWSWVLCSIIVGWVLMWSGYTSSAQMLGFTACASSAVAATAHIHCYFKRVCRLIRATYGIERPEPSGELHRIR